MIYSLGERKVKASGEDYFIADNATVIGSVVIHNDVSIWFNAIIRGDNDLITIGEGTNIQDNSVIHVTHVGPYTPQGAPTIIGNHVTAGHRVLLHACQIGDYCLIGMGAIVMDDAVIEDNVILGAGSLVPPGKVLKAGHLYVGSPAKQIRKLNTEEIERIHYSAKHYAQLSDSYR